MGKYARRGSIGIVGFGEQIGTHHVGGDGQHQRSFRVIGVPVLGVGETELTHAWAERCRVEQRDHESSCSARSSSSAQRKGAALVTWVLTMKRRRTPE